MTEPPPGFRDSQGGRLVKDLAWRANAEAEDPNSFTPAQFAISLQAARVVHGIRGAHNLSRVVVQIGYGQACRCRQCTLARPREMLHQGIHPEVGD